MIKRIVTIRLEMPWHTKHNVIGYGVFLKHHMETYKGMSVKTWECGLSKECNDVGESNIQIS
ncbi:hypothetical protein Hanom_Chr17g01580121 [Helianthus anomalus]